MEEADGLSFEGALTTLDRLPRTCIQHRKNLSDQRRPTLAAIDEMIRREV